MKSRTTGIYLIVALAAVITLVLALSPDLVIESTYPAGRLRQIIRDSVFSRIGGIFSASGTAAENVRLRREAESARLLRNEVLRVEEENARLRRLLNFRESLGGEWKSAEVLSRGGGAARVRDVIRISSGSLAGIAEGAVVIAPEGLVGRVASVTPHTAEIKLLTDPSIMVSCLVDGDSGSLQATLCGGEDELQLRYFRRGAQASSGARVVTSGCGGVYPRGLAVGTLVSFEQDGRSSGSIGCVRPAVDFANLESVFVRCGK